MLLDCLHLATVILKALGKGGGKHYELKLLMDCTMGNPHFCPIFASVRTMPCFLGWFQRNSEPVPFQILWERTYWIIKIFWYLLLEPCLANLNFYFLECPCFVACAVNGKLLETHCRIFSCSLSCINMSLQRNLCTS